MKKTAKGALAGAAAVTLLAGGAGTLAFWNDTSDFDGGTITAGTLKLGDPTVTVTFNGTPIDATDLADVLIVPGDRITYTGSWTLDATGDNLEATVDISGLDSVTSVAGELDVTTAYTLAGAAFTTGSTITEDDDGKTLTAEAVIDFPFADATNASQGMTVDLSDVAVTVTQTDATP